MSDISVQWSTSYTTDECHFGWTRHLNSRIILTVGSPVYSSYTLINTCNVRTYIQYVQYYAYVHTCIMCINEDICVIYIYMHIICIYTYMYVYILQLVHEMWQLQKQCKSNNWLVIAFLSALYNNTARVRRSAFPVKRFSYLYCTHLCLCLTDLCTKDSICYTFAPIWQFCDRTCNDYGRACRYVLSVCWRRWP